jgi:hypothetical protein
VKPALSFSASDIRRCILASEDDKGLEEVSLSREGRSVVLRLAVELLGESFRAPARAISQRAVRTPSSVIL